MLNTLFIIIFILFFHDKTKTKQQLVEEKERITLDTIIRTTEKNKMLVVMTIVQAPVYRVTLLMQTHNRLCNFQIHRALRHKYIQDIFGEYWCNTLKLFSRNIKILFFNI